VEECLNFCETVALKAFVEEREVGLANEKGEKKQAEITVLREESKNDKEEEQKEHIVDEVIFGNSEGAIGVGNRQVESTEFLIMLEEKHGGYFRLKVGKGLDLAKAFDEFEKRKADLRIYDYNISQFSLEQVFINLARNQEEEPVKYFNGQSPTERQSQSTHPLYTEIGSSNIAHP
jgi:hypothetical protein